MALCKQLGLFPATGQVKIGLLRLVLLLGNHVIRYYLSMWVDGAHYPGRVIHLGVSSLVSTQN